MATLIGSNHVPIEHIIAEDDDFDDLVIAVSKLLQFRCLMDREPLTRGAAQHCCSAVAARFSTLAGVVGRYTEALGRWEALERHWRFDNPSFAGYSATNGRRCRFGNPLVPAGTHIDGEEVGLKAAKAIRVSSTRDSMGRK
ncbi:hypothetical protein E4U61_000585 [Claviceps capensis]|nr:hypothetical protein E4U61_000585 [Claviceps capensis]